jgi:periplasmic protein TonB
MSKINIYETGWLNMVFEGRNKAYGAYQLRTENPKTTVKAFFSAMALFASLAVIPAIISYLKADDMAIITPKTNDGGVILIDAETFKKEEPKKEEPAPETSKPLTDEKTIKNVTMVPVKKENATTETIATNEELEKAKIGSENQNGKENNGNGLIIEPTKTGNGGGTSPSGTIETTIGLEKQPEYPGGLGAFLNAVGRNFKTPNVDEEIKTLKVMVYFVIEPDGTLSNIRVTRDPGYNLGKEATRVLNAMKTKWSPGYKNGQAVRTAYNLPITINVQ